VQQIPYAQGPASHLVLVGRADTTAGCAEGGLAAGLFAGLVQLCVVRQDQRAGFAQAQALSRGDAAALQRGDFIQQGRWTHHDAVADETHDLVAQDTGRDKV
jgi:hypothetical protein